MLVSSPVSGGGALTSWAFVAGVGEAFSVHKTVLVTLRATTVGMHGSFGVFGCALCAMMERASERSSLLERATRDMNLGVYLLKGTKKGGQH